MYDVVVPPNAKQIEILFKDEIPVYANLALCIDTRKCLIYFIHFYKVDSLIWWLINRLVVLNVAQELCNITEFTNYCVMYL